MLKPSTSLQSAKSSPNSAPRSRSRKSLATSSAVRTASSFTSIESSIRAYQSKISLTSAQMLANCEPGEAKPPQHSRTWQSNMKSAQLQNVPCKWDQNDLVERL